MFLSFDQHSKRDKLQELKSIIDPSILLNALGFDVHKVSERDFRAKCIIHGGKNKTSFAFNNTPPNYFWICFSASCHELYGSDVIGLVRAVLKCGFKEAVEYIADLFSYDLTSSELSEQYYDIKQVAERDSFIRRLRKPAEVILDESFLSNYKNNKSIFFANRFSSITLDFFEVCSGYVGSDGIVRDVIPIRNKDNKLVGASFRSSIDGYQPKYLHSEFDKSRYLYNENNVFMSSGNMGFVILVEGFSDVWSLYEVGYLNCLGIMGSSLSQEQSISIMSHYNQVLVLADGDDSGIKGAYRSKKLLESGCIVTVVCLPNGYDPASLDRCVLYNIVSKEHLFVEFP